MIEKEIKNYISKDFYAIFKHIELLLKTSKNTLFNYEIFYGECFVL